MKKSKSKNATTNHFKRWTSKEDSDLKEAINAGYDVRETATLLGRTVDSIHTRKSQLFSVTGDDRRFPITDRKDNTPRLHKFQEFDEHQQQLIRRELLNTPREALGIKWSIDKRTLRQYPDVASGDSVRAYHATLLFETKQEAANHLGIHLRTLYRRLVDICFSFDGYTHTAEAFEKMVTEDSLPLPPVGSTASPLEVPTEHTEPTTSSPEFNSAALLVRDVVIALKPYGVSCSFEFEGDQVTKMTANFS